MPAVMRAEYCGPAGGCACCGCEELLGVRLALALGCGVTEGVALGLGANGLSCGHAAAVEACIVYWQGADSVMMTLPRPDVRAGSHPRMYVIVRVGITGHWKGALGLGAVP